MNRCEFVGRLRADPESIDQGAAWKAVLGVGMPAWDAENRRATSRTVWVSLVWAHRPDMADHQMPYKGDRVHVVAELTQNVEEDGSKKNPTRFSVVQLDIVERARSNQNLGGQ